MDLTAGLMGAANAGEGFLAGKQTAIQNTATNQMNALAIKNSQNLMANQKAQALLHQQFIDQAMQTSATQPISLNAGQAQPQQPQQPQVDPSQLAQRASNLANWAFSHGDSGDATFATNMADKLSSAALNQQKLQSNIQTANLARQQKSVSYVASLTGAAPRTTDGFNQVIDTALASPDVSEEEKGNLMRLKANGNAAPSKIPALMDFMQKSGETAAQQRQHQIDLQKANQQQAEDQAKSDHYARQDKLAQQKFDWDQKKATANAKAGKTGTPSTNELAVTTQFVNSQTPGGTMSQGVGLQVTNQVAEFAKQLQQRTPGLTYMNAIQQAYDVMQKSGQIQTQTQPTGGMDIPVVGRVGGHDQTSISGFNSAVGSRDNPIPFQKGDDPKTLQVGKYYKVPGDPMPHMYNGQ